MNRRALAALALGATLPLAACGGGSSGVSSTASGGTTDALTWSMWISGKEDQTAWQKVADTASDGGAKITIQGAPFNDYWTKLRTQLSGSDAPCIVTIQSLRAADFTDVLLPLDDLATQKGTKLDEFDTTALDGMKVDGKVYALPYDTGPVVMFYNKDLFKQAGVTEPKVGWTAAEFEAAGEKFKAGGKQLFAPTVEDLFLESQVLAYNGGRVVTTDGALDASSAAFAQGLDWDASLVAKGYAPQVSADPTADDNAFVNGQVATYVDGPWSLLSTKAKAKFDLGVTSLPAGSAPATFSAGSGFGISKKCQYPDQAFAAIQKMTSPEVLSDLGKQGRAFPARTASQSAWYDNAGIDGVKPTFEAVQKSSVPLPGNKSSDELSQLFTQYGIQAVNGQSSGADTMQQIASQLPQ